MDPSVAPLSTAFTSARVLLAIVFLIAGIPKLVAGTDLSNTLRTLGVERRAFVAALRIGVPMAETALGVWLTADWYPAAASLAAVTMLTAFTLVVVRLRERGSEGCACFIWTEGRVGIGHVVRNLVLVTIAAVIAIVTIIGSYAWEPVWMLPVESALVVAASVVFVFVTYALIAASMRFARITAADS